MSPGKCEFRKAVQQKHRIAVTLFINGQIDAVAFHLASFREHALVLVILALQG